MKPILFNTDMVRAILDGRKNVTRRVVMQSIADRFVIDESNHLLGCFDEARPEWDVHPAIDYAPYQPGDILYVRETWFYEEHMHDLTVGEPDLPSGRYSHRYIFKANNPDYPVNVGAGATGWRPSIHMPKEAARIFLRVTDVRVERLRRITSYEIVKEGIDNSKCIPPSSKIYRLFEEFKTLWNNTIKPADRDRYGWSANPWVWVIEFKRISKGEAMSVT